MEIVLRTMEKGQEFAINHDLNFQSEKYEARHPVVGILRRTPTEAESVDLRMLTMCAKGFQRSKRGCS